MTDQQAPDMWDDCGSFLYQKLPETDVETFMTGETTDLIKITEESDGYWLQCDGDAGAVRYGKMADAKAAGDRVMEGLYARQPQAIVASAKLDPEAWSFTHEGEECKFVRIDAPDTGIVRIGAGHWVLDVAGEESCESASPAAVAEAYDARQSFSPSI